MANKLVAGIDSSTQSVKVVIKDAITGQLIREGKLLTQMAHQFTHPTGLAL